MTFSARSQARRCAAESLKWLAVARLGNASLAASNVACHADGRDSTILIVVDPLRAWDESREH